jgi:hypothetical protein
MANILMVWKLLTVHYQKLARQLGLTAPIICMYFGFTLVLAVRGFAATEEAPISAPKAGNSVYRSAPQWTEPLTSFTTNYSSFLKNMIGYNWYTYAAVIGVTGAFLPYDQVVQDKTQRFAEKNKLAYIGGSQERPIAEFIVFKSEQTIHVPRSATGVFWYFGEGSFSLGIALAAGAYGYMNSDFQSMHVALQIIESLMVAGPTVLLTKMATGRESPIRATRPGGKWQGFPGFLEYSHDQPRYYAFPSGHTATAVSTLTVIAENYIENKWIVPVGSTMVGLLMFSLGTIQAHWISDYPLAVMIGYTAGHSVVTNAREAQQGQAENKLTAYYRPTGNWEWKSVAPFCDGVGCGMSSNWEF